MNYLSGVWDLLQGKKTYLVALAGVIWGLHLGDVNTVLAALALVGLRSALKKIE